MVFVYYLLTNNNEYVKMESENLKPGILKEEFQLQGGAYI